MSAGNIRIDWDADEDEPRFVATCPIDDWSGLVRIDVGWALNDWTDHWDEVHP